MPSFGRLFTGMLIVYGLLWAQTERKKITLASDLPVFQYPVKGHVEDLVESTSAWQPFADQIRKDVESVLRDYDIEDASAKRNLLGTLASLDLLDGRYDDALQVLDQIRALEEKPSQKAVSGMLTRSLLAASSKNPDRNSPEYRKAVYDYLKAELDPLPYALVANDVKGMKANAEVMNRNLLIGQIQGMLDPVVEKSGTLSSDLADRLPGIRVMLLYRIPLGPVFTEALNGYLSAHNEQKADIWAARRVSLPPGQSYAPVKVAVWDSGVDVALYREQVVKNSDGNPALLAYDLNAEKTSGYLYPLPPDVQKNFKADESELKGFTDLQANVESPEATALKKKLAALEPAESKAFLEQLSMLAVYSHGTHVAGILLAGNPYAQLVTARISFDYKMIPDPCPSDALEARSTAATRAYVDFFKQQGVRVVNMSWGGTEKEEEDALEKCGIGKSVAERQTLAKRYFEKEKDSLQQAIAAAPGILFIAAGGNSNGSTGFEDSIPAGLKLPNLVSVGAVDLAGDETSFTSYGPTVLLHANGYEVESFVPGGDRIKMSGTSMASPDVANLAAKILAVNPKLTPPQVIDMMRNTTDKTADGRRFLVNPKKAIEKAAAS